MESWNASSENTQSNVHDEVNQSLLGDDDDDSKGIPTWDNLSTMYESRWHKEKEKFHKELRGNFFATCFHT